MVSPAIVAERLVKAKKKADSYHLIKSIIRFPFKVIKWTIFSLLILVGFAGGLRSCGVPVEQYVKNAVHNIKHHLERKDLNELTKQIQLQEQIEAKRKAEEQKKLDSIKNASKKPKEKKNKNKRHSLLEDKFYRVMKMQNSGFVNLNPQSTQYGNTRFKPQKIS